MIPVIRPQLLCSLIAALILNGNINTPIINDKKNKSRSNKEIELDDKLCAIVGTTPTIKKREVRATVIHAEPRGQNKSYVQLEGA